MEISEFDVDNKVIFILCCVTLQVMAFTKAGGKFEDQNHLGIYLASLAATASLSLYMARK